MVSSSARKSFRKPFRKQSGVCCLLREFLVEPALFRYGPGFYL